MKGRLARQQCSEPVGEPPQTIPFELPAHVEPFVISDRERLLLEGQKRSA